MSLTMQNDEPNFSVSTVPGAAMTLNDKPQSELRLTETDRAILGLLQQDSWRTISEIAEAVRVSRATVKDRIDLMKERGVIKRFTIDISESQQDEPSCGSFFFQLRLKRPVCRIVYAAISGWPELVGCWSIAGDLDMIVLIAASSNREVERLRDKLARHPEVKTLTTLTILREWTDRRDRKFLEILDGLGRPRIEGTERLGA